MQWFMKGNNKLLLSTTCFRQPNASLFFDTKTHYYLYY